MAMGGPIDTPELNLISDSVQNASARIKLFRVAFGVASVEQMIGTPEIGNVIADVFGETRYHVTWAGTGGVPRAEAQALYLALLCLETALPQGGDITISGAQGDWRLTGSGHRLADTPDLWACLSGRETPDLSPAQVQFGLLPLCLAAMGKTAQVTPGETSVTLAF